MFVIGIDVSKEKLDCAWLRDVEALKIKNKVISNHAKGFEALCQWSERQTGANLSETLFVMEATGIYHEALAYHLHQRGARVAVLNPAWVRDYARSLGIRSKNDKKDAMVLARYGATQSISLWKPEPEEVRELKALISRLDAVERDIRREENRKEKAQCAQTSNIVMNSIDSILGSLRQEKQRLDKEIDDHINRHPTLKKDKQLLKSIPGVGDVVARCMMSVYRSRHFTKAGSMAAFFGLVPVDHESGTSVRGRPHLSKAGSSMMRAKLYMPAVVAAHHNPDAMALYQRLLGKGKSKMTAIGAVMRKLVHICFGVLKHQQAYVPQVS
jgi:transposase